MARLGWLRISNHSLLFGWVGLDWLDSHVLLFGSKDKRWLGIAICLFDMPLYFNIISLTDTQARAHTHTHTHNQPSIL